MSVLFSDYGFRNGFNISSYNVQRPSRTSWIILSVGSIESGLNRSMFEAEELGAVCPVDMMGTARPQ